MSKLDFYSLTDEQKEFLQSAWEEHENENKHKNDDDDFSQEEFLKYIKEKKAEIQREQEALSFMQSMMV